MWAGSNTILIDNQPAVNQAFTDFVNNNGEDIFAAVILAYAFVQSADIFIIAGDFQYGKPVVNPPILQNLTAIPNIGSTLRITSLSNLTLEFEASNPSGFRQVVIS
jgi:hypothetical protein